MSVGRSLSVLCLISIVACGGDDDGGGADGGTKRIDLDITGCDMGVQAQSLLVRVEGTTTDGMCTLEQKCIDVTFNGETSDDIESVLRSQGFPLFDVAADEIERITVGLSFTAGCPLGVLTAACGSAPITGNESVVTIALACDGMPACPAVVGECN